MTAFCNYAKCSKDVIKSLKKQKDNCYIMVWLPFFARNNIILQSNEIFLKRLNLIEEEFLVNYNFWKTNFKERCSLLEGGCWVIHSVFSVVIIQNSKIFEPSFERHPI